LNHEGTCLRQGAESWKKLKAQSEEDQRSKLPSAAGGLVFITFIREVMKKNHENPVNPVFPTSDIVFT